MPPKKSKDQVDSDQSAQSGQSPGQGQGQGQGQGLGQGVDGSQVIIDVF